MQLTDNDQPEIPTTSAQREIELKYAVPSTRIKEISVFLTRLKSKGKIDVLGTRTFDQEDVYFDSDAFDLARHHCSLRVRKKEGDRGVLTFKRSNIISSTALADRMEIGGRYSKSTLARITRQASWLLMLDGRTRSSVKKRKFSALETLGLNKCLTVRNNRTIYELKFKDAVTIALSLDMIRAHRGDRNGTFCELEAELISGDQNMMTGFDEYLRARLDWLRSSRISKYERSLKALKIWKRNRALAAEDLDQWSKRLQKVYGKFNSAYRRVLRFKDVEDLHACRVALRQLLTLLEFLRPNRKEPAQLVSLRHALYKIQKTLGRLRDRDVYIIFATVEPALQLDSEELENEFLHVLNLERDQQRLLATVKLPKYYNAELKHVWNAFIKRRLPGLVKRLHVEYRYAQLMQQFEAAYRLLRRTRKRMGHVHPATVKQLHKTRILAKNVRYASQHLAFALPGDSKRLVPGFTDLQDSMGEINDLSNYIKRTREVAEQFEELLGPSLRPRITMMEEELEGKLLNFDVPDLEEIVEVGEG